ncbi:MAG: hypothetical protein DDT19_02148 [Syntrophomonadaceae bacterium]|nr:hypothetical protein [Bacillota bacterium]
MKLKYLKQFLTTNFPVLLNFIRKVRSLYYPLLVEKQRKKLSGLIKRYYKTTSDSEILEILSYLETNRVEMIPYEFTKECKAHNIVVMRDDKSNHPYVILGGNKVYFPKESDHEEIREGVIGSLIEQHDKSPHRYLTEQFNIDYGDTALFVGASDGIFCLSIIDKLKKVYLFEPDIKWIASLNLTFAPWKEKVEIIQKYVSNTNDSQTVTLDSFLAARKEQVNYIQADIEGAEKELLLGAENVLSKSNKLKLSICCYHEQTDQEELSNILRAKGYNTMYSHGYMLMWMQLPCKIPYLRKGVIYASRP